MPATPRLSINATVAMRFICASYPLREIILKLVLLSLVQASARRESGHECNNYFLDAEITRLLKAWRAGDQAALDQLSKHVYGELRLLARRHMRNERPGNTLQTTALVHEVYLRLVDV